MPATFSRTLPTKDRLLVELHDWKGETDGEVSLIGDNAKNMRMGFVEEVGPDLKRADGIIPPHLKKGQKVLFDRTGSIGFDFEGGPCYMLIQESAILAVMGYEDDDALDDEGEELD